MGALFSDSLFAVFPYVVELGSRGNDGDSSHNIQLLLPVERSLNMELECKEEEATVFASRFKGTFPINQFELRTSTSFSRFEPLSKCRSR